MRKIMYLGLDVDDKAFHGCGLFDVKKAEEQLAFKSKPSVGSLTEKLSEFKKRGFDLKICYEATYVGFSLFRDLKKRGFDVSVIAPSSIPRASGDTVKTDRVDSEKLARYFKKDLLTVVNVPDEEEEQVRNLCRSRIFLARQVNDLKRHLVSMCRKLGLNYKAASGLKNPAYFTQMHLRWLESEVVRMNSEMTSFTVKMMLSQITQMQGQVEALDDKIASIAEQPKYQRRVNALKCYRGLDVLGSMVMVTEIGDIKRFSHPSKLTSYVGMDLREYSSGGRERRFKISKMGNHRLRWLTVESCQRANKIPSVSMRLKLRRKNIEPEFIEIADRCMKRLYKKSQHMLMAGKPVNKIKIACGRELLCFVWESLMKADQTLNTNRSDRLEKGKVA